MVQSGIDIEIDYDLIGKYVNDNRDKFSKNVIEEINISNQELKKLKRELGEVLEKFSYNI